LEELRVRRFADIQEEMCFRAASKKYTLYGQNGPAAQRIYADKSSNSAKP